MAARIISWKIDDYKYAYLVKVGGSHISNRITDASVLAEMVKEVGGYSYSTYYNAFQEMNKELYNAYSVTVPEKIGEYYGNVKVDDILILTGKDGAKGADGSGGYPGTGSGSSIYDDFNDAIDKKLDEIKEDIKKDNEDVKNELENKVTDSLTDAKKEIEDTKKELDDVRKDLEKKLGDAKDALDKASKLFELDDENITPDAIKEVFSATSEFSDWMTDYSGFVQNIKTDYERASTKMGLIGTGESALDGLFTWFGTSLNTTSGTVGSVRQDLAAVSGVIAQYATWYDENAESAANAARIINASAATIEDTIKYIQGSGLTTEIERKMDAMAGTIIDKALAESELGVASVKNELNALSAYVLTQIVYENPDGTLTVIGDKMKAIEGEMERYMTRTDNLMKETTDLRESWSIASGKLSTVAQLTAETDADGNIIYYTSGSSGEQVVYYNPENGKFYYDKGFMQECPASKVYVHFSSVLDSYIKQTASSITISVSDNSALTASIKAEILGDKSFINMIADEVNIDAEVIMRELSAKTGNIGGIILHDGLIYSMKENEDRNPEFILNGKNGGFSATNAYIRGDIVAKSLTLGDGTSMSDYIDDKIKAAVTGSTGTTGTTGATTGLTEDEVNKLIEGYIKSKEFNDLLLSGGYITKDNIYNYVTSGSSGMSQAEIEALCERLVGAEVNKALGVEEMEDGRLKHTVIVGGKEYTWITADIGNYLLLDTMVSGTSGDSNYSFVVDKKGLLQANNAIIYGEIYANKGYIGKLTFDEGAISGDGFTISKEGINGNGWNFNGGGDGGGSGSGSGSGGGAIITKGRIGAVNITDYGLEVYSGNTLTAFINGSADFASDKSGDKGRIIYSAGVAKSGDTMWYAWTTDDETTLGNNGVLYTLIDYANSASTASFINGNRIDCYLRTGDGTVLDECYASTYYYDEETGKNIYVNRIYNFYSPTGARVYYIRNTNKDVSLNTNELGSTKIYEDGTIVTNKLEARGGTFLGNLDVQDGVFRGKINATGGTLNNVTASNIDINGNISLYNGNSLVMYSGSSKDPIFKIENSPIGEDKETTQYIHDLKVKEINVTEYDKNFNEYKILASSNVLSGDTILIPEITFKSKVMSYYGQDRISPTVKLIGDIINSAGTVVTAKTLNIDLKYISDPRQSVQTKLSEWSGQTSSFDLSSTVNGYFRLKVQYDFTVKGKPMPNPRPYFYNATIINGYANNNKLKIYGNSPRKPLMKFGTDGFRLVWGNNNIVSFMPSTDAANAFDILLQVNNVWYPNDDSKIYGIKLTYGGIRMNFGDGNGWKTIEPDSNGFLKAY